MKLCIIYIRVSDAGQEDNYSLDTQELECRRYAYSLGFKDENIIVFRDVASGGTLSRSGLEKARSLIRSSQVSVFVALTSDRLSRSVGQMIILRAELRDHDVALHFVSKGQVYDTSDGNFMSTIESAVAEYERERIKERMNRGSRGKVTGTPNRPGQPLGWQIAPYGYSWQGNGSERKLVINPDEARIVRSIYLWYLEGIGAHAIAKLLTKQGVLTPSDGGRYIARRRVKEVGYWQFTTVQNILKSEVYIGKLHHFKVAKRRGENGRLRPRDEWLTTPCPTIIDTQTWEAVQDIRQHRNERYGPSNRIHQYLLSGRVKHDCGVGMAGHFRHGKRRVYRCNAPNTLTTCNMTVKSVDAELLERVVFGWVRDELLNPDRLEAAIRSLEQERKDVHGETQQAIRELDRAIEKKDQEIARLLTAYASGVIELSELTDAIQACKAAKKAIGVERDTMHAKVESEGPSEDELREMLTMAGAINELVLDLDATTFEERQTILTLWRIRCTVFERDSEQWVAIQGRLSNKPVDRLIRDNGNDDSGTPPNNGDDNEPRETGSLPCLLRTTCINIQTPKMVLGSHRNSSRR